MELASVILTEMQLWAWQENLDYWIFVAAMFFLLFEGIRYAVNRKLKFNMVADGFANFCTLAASTGINILLGTVYVVSFYFVYEYVALWYIPSTIWSLALCILLADFAYYWEHRFSHRVGFAWGTHSVHHSSPYFNISVAYRFGPLDGVIALFFHLPLAVLGFNPFVIFLSQAIVLLYQTFLHTETIGKLPKPIEMIFNTPSHHRVHHGRNSQYIDKNYAGMFIVWDKMFKTFAEEQEQVDYGITRPINSVNPLIVFFHGYARLFTRMREAKGIKNTFATLITPP